MPQADHDVLARQAGEDVVAFHREFSHRHCGKQVDPGAREIEIEVRSAAWFDAFPESGDGAEEGDFEWADWVNTEARWVEIKTWEDESLVLGSSSLN